MGEEEEQLLGKGAIERIGLDKGNLWLQDGGHETVRTLQRDFPDHQTAIVKVFGLIDELRLSRPVAVGHRVVHGGPSYMVHTQIEAELLNALREQIPFAPLHLPSAIQAIEAVSEHFPDLPQVACFDTAFHRCLPEVARRFPLPREFWDEGLKRYGFHGLSYEYILGESGPGVECRMIIAHLGNGASMAAVRNGQPLDTTMGFTPTGGIMMGTRSGDLDPGILLYLMKEKGYTGAHIDDLVNHHSGLLGVSAISPDMKTLLEKRETEPTASQAVDMFCYQLRKQIGAYAAVLGGLDTLVFTGGIGERAAQVRWETCRRLEFLGISLDAELNEKHAPVISKSGNPCSVRIIPTKEDLMIARHTKRIVFGI
jgi:acetate kinase